MKVNAMVLQKFNSPLTSQEFEVPVLQDGEMLVRMLAAGVCGSDVHIWKGEDKRVPLPIILGHEGVGEIAEIKGERFTVDGTKLKAGDIILWNRGISCGVCYYCKVLNQPSLCTSRKVYGINRSCEEYPYLNGCYSEYVFLTKNTDIFLIDKSTDPSVMVAASCSGATVAHAYDIVSPDVGDTVVVQGPGPIGLFSIAFAKERGASNIVVIGGSKERMKLCSEFGATMLLNRNETTVEERRERVMDLTRGRGADLVVEAVGYPDVVKEGIALTRNCGTYLMGGFAQFTGNVEIDFFSEVVKKNIRIQGVWVSDTRHTHQAISIINKNPGLYGKMITHTYSLSDANKALEAMRKKEAMKAVLLPG